MQTAQHLSIGHVSRLTALASEVGCGQTRPFGGSYGPATAILFLAANSSIRRKPVFRNVDDIHIVGIFPNYESAHNAWKAEAQRTVDNAHMRYFIAHLHRLRDEEAAASSTEELGA